MSEEMPLEENSAADIVYKKDAAHWSSTNLVVDSDGLRHRVFFSLWS